MDRRDYGTEKGSVRRARERVGASLDHIRTEPSVGESWLRSPDPANGESPHRTPSQESAPWPLASSRETVQDILQHPLMSQQPQLAPQSRNQNDSQTNGELLTSFKFPNFPPPQSQPKQPPPGLAPRRSRDIVPPPSARRPGVPYQYDNSKAHVSPIVEEGPDASLRSRSMLSRASSGVLAYDSTPNLATLDQSEYDYSSRASTPPLPHYEPQIIRQASLGKKAKPALTNIRGYTPSSPQHAPQQYQQQTKPTSFNPNIPPSRQATISALSAALASGIGHHHQDIPEIHTPTGAAPRSMTPGGTVRMPFDDSISPPLSPISVETTIGPGYENANHYNARPFGGTSTKSKSPLLTPEAERSRNPPQFQTAHPGLSEKIPSSRRPPPLEFDQVASERASTTSLADLIKRATKLAANLDRGKTASRLGMLDMFYGDGEKPKRRDPNEKRESGISDMLGAFPGTPGRLASEKGAWPEDGVKMNRLPSRQGHRSKSQAQKRRCCGMSVTMFLIVLVILIILVAAAVLVPVFLILVPRMNKNDAANAAPSLASCQNDFNCANGGIQVVVAGACSCICTGGHTGNHCEAPQAANCTTANVGGIHDATMAFTVVDLLQRSEKNFSIPLDSSTILGLFSANDLACMDEESLLDFNFQTTQNKRSPVEKRFYPINEMDTSRLDIDHFMPVDVARRSPQPTAKPNLAHRVVAVRNPIPTTVATSNGVVFQATSSTEEVQITATAAAPSASGTTSPSATSIPTRELNFARVVVLYVLEQSGALSVAVNAHLLLQNYIAAGGQGSVEVGFGSLDLRADFGPQGPRILWGNGTVVGI